MDELIKKSGKWMEVSDLSSGALSKLLLEKQLDPPLAAKITEFAALEKSPRLFLAPLKDEERLFEVRDI